MNEYVSPPRPHKVPVRLVGGPDDWHGQVLDEVYAAADLAGLREDLGAALVSEYVPGAHPDSGALAVYEPDGEPAIPSVWFFRGWLPDWPGSPERRRPSVVRALEVDVDDEGLPSELIDPARPGDRVRVVRVLAHWDHTTADGDAVDVWHVATRDGDHHLEHHLGEGWTGGPLR
ncbi:hypothetical protein [Nocardiopsis flavescens]